MLQSELLRCFMSKTPPNFDEIRLLIAMKCFSRGRPCRPEITRCHRVSLLLLPCARTRVRNQACNQSRSQTVGGACSSKVVVMDKRRRRRGKLIAFACARLLVFPLSCSLTETHDILEISRDLRPTAAAITLLVCEFSRSALTARFKGSRAHRST